MADGHAKHLAPAIGVDAHRDDDRDRDNLVVAADFDVGGVEPNVRPIPFDRPLPVELRIPKLRRGSGPSAATR